jgi:hypothetical protein
MAAASKLFEAAAISPVYLPQKVLRQQPYLQSTCCCLKTGDMAAASKLFEAVTCNRQSIH